MRKIAAQASRLAARVAKPSSLRAARWLIGLVSVTTLALAATTLDPVEQKGVAWLSAQVQGNGTLASESAAMATPLQAREETAHTLAYLASAPSVMFSTIASNKDADTESVARRLFAAGASGQTDAADVTTLLALQGSDGGWALNTNYQSDALDTAYALAALRAVNASATDAATRGVAYLTQSRGSDGGWGPDGQSAVFVTANVVLAGAAWSDKVATAGTLASGASQWLVGALGAATDYGDTLSNAHALRALATQGSQSDTLAPLSAALDATQLADGSWADDTYLTAVALHAHWFAGQPQTNPTTGDISGTVIDRSTGKALPGATVKLLENAGISAVAAADGSFHLASIPPATYSLQAAMAGYQTLTGTVSVIAGTQLKVGALALAPIPTTANLSGVVTAGDTGLPLAGAIVAAGSRSTLTDANGVYQLLGLAPGAATLSASLTGYQTATASVTFVAGTSYLFSPTLYPNNTTVPATSLQGRVIDAVSRIAIAGASVVYNGSTQLTDAAGKFVFASANEGAFSLAVSASGYQSVTSSGSLVKGINDVGAIGLSAAPQSSSLHGIVYDDQNRPVPNALVSIDNGPSSSSAADGSYSISGLAGTQYGLHVSATGFITQAFVFTIPAPGDYTQDFHLVAQNASALTMGPLTVAPASAGANNDISASTTLLNGGSSAFDGILILVVRDATDAVIGTGALTDAAGFSIGAIHLAAGDHLGVIGRWNTALFAPGAYRFEMRLVQPGSVQRSAPLGTLVLNQFGAFTITPTTHFSGTVAGDPPAIQAGLNQTVHFTAPIRNDGNVVLAAQTYTLQALDSAGNVGYSATAALAQIPVNGVIIADFGSWLPGTGGNYTLYVGAADPTIGRLTGTQYVGNVAQATFTVNPHSVLAGTQIVHGNIHVTGVNPAQATITDPLAPLMRTATQNAVTYNDTAAHAWIDRNRCSSCHIGNQALIGGETTRALTTFNAYDRSVIINNISTNQAPDGGITQGYNGYQYRLGTLSLWGLLSYNNLTEFRTVVKHAADWVVRFQASNGDWQSDYNSAWFDSDISMAMLNLSNLHHADDFFRTNNITSVPAYAVQQALPTQPANSRAFISNAPGGNLFYTDQSNASVNLIQPDGTRLNQWLGLNDPRSVVARQDGQVWVSTGSGVFKLNSDGSNTQLSTQGNIDSLALGPDGTVWATVFGDRSLYQLDATGAMVTWLANGPFSGIARTYPDSDGSLLVTDYYNSTIYRVAADKTVTPVIEVMEGAGSSPNLIELLKDGDHWMLSTTIGIFRFSSAWEGQRVSYARADAMVRLADGTVEYVAYGTAGINKFVVTQEPVAPSLTQFASAIDLGAAWLQAQNLNTSDNLHQAQQLWGLGEAYRYYQTRDAGRAATLHAAMMTLAGHLRANQAADGGWGYYTGSASDALVTAQVGIALDYTDPSASDPAIRSAVVFLLSQQQADGSWGSADGIMSTHESTTTMVAIWLPTILDRLGSIDAQVSVTFPQNIQAAFRSPAPDATSKDASGNATSSWSLTGVTDDGRDIDFDLTLLDMGAAEIRAAALDAHMTFANSFNQQTVNLPIAIPSITASAPVSLDIVTDKPEYPANATAQVTTTLVNDDVAEVDGTLTVTVLDATGVLVGTVTQEPASLPAGASVPVTRPFAIGTIPPGPYTALAVLANNGATLAQGQTTFNVLPDNLAASAMSTLATDRALYNPTDHVLISSRAISESSNLLLQDLHLVVSVFDASATQQFTHTYAIAQLLPQATLAFSVTQPLAAAPPGTYTVKQDLLDAQNRVYHHDEVTYVVASSSDTGFGLTGTIVATPKSVRTGETLGLAATAHNSGNADLANLPLTIYLVDPDLGTVVAQFTQTQTLAMGGTVPFDTPWIAQGRTNATYLAVLVATVGQGANTTGLTLAQDTFQILPQVAAGITATGGTPQSATTTQPYAIALQATVRDTVGNVMPGITVTFVAPASGASVTFASGNTAVTDANGNAVVPVIANATAGSFTVVATAPGVANEADFALTNTTPTASTIVASGGTPQSADVGAAYAAALQALVSNNLGQPMAGVAVTFAAPASGASVTFPGGQVAITDASGHASVPVIANATAGSFTVTATATNVQGSATFALTNTVSATTQADVGVRVSAPSQLWLGTATSSQAGTTSAHVAGSAGDSLVYTVTVQNAGPDDAADVMLSAQMPGGLRLSGIVGSACAQMPCSLGLLHAHASLRLQVGYDVDAGYAGRSIAASFAVAASTPDPNLANNAANVTTRVAAAGADNQPVPFDARWLAALFCAVLFAAMHRIRMRRQQDGKAQATEGKA